jgi:protocatechuate 3,4-dioxygenase beta subunit
MRFNLLVFIMAAGSLAAQQSASQVAASSEQNKIRLEGRITASSGEPLRKATVILQPANPATPRDTNPLSTYSDSSDAQGNFVFEDVRPGAYQLRAEHTGFVTQRYGARTPSDNGTPLTLKEGSKLSKLDIALTQQAVILGRVTDPEGDGVPNISVRAARFTYLNGIRLLRSEGIGGTTDDEGNFRISALSPGRYYLVADNQVGTPQQVLNPLIAGRSVALPNTLISTYYPGSLNLRGATQIEAGPGTHVSANIQMRRENVFTIRGIVTKNGAPAARAAVVAISEEELPAMGQSAPAFSASLPFMSSAQTDAQGRFELRNVLPGTHTLRVMGGGRLEVNTIGGSSFMTSMGQASQTDINGYLQVTVPNANVDNVNFAANSTGEIVTKVAVYGGTLDELKNDLPKPQTPTPAPAAAPQIFLPGVRLLPGGGISVNGPSNSTNPDGTLRITNITPGRYYINATNLPPSYYVRSMRYGGVDVTRSQLEFTSSGELEITVAKGTGEIGGTVTNKNGDPVGGVVVSLWPKVPNNSTPTGAARIATTDQSGGFKFTNTSPEEYYLAAFEEVPEPGLAQYVGFLNGFSSDAVAIKLEPNATPTASLQLVTKEKVAATITRLQL